MAAEEKTQICKWMDDVFAVGGHEESVPAPIIPDGYSARPRRDDLEKRDREQMFYHLAAMAAKEELRLLDIAKNGPANGVSRREDGQEQQQHTSTHEALTPSDLVAHNVSDATRMYGNPAFGSTIDPTTLPIFTNHSHSPGGEYVDALSSVDPESDDKSAVATRCTDSSYRDAKRLKSTAGPNTNTPHWSHYHSHAADPVETKANMSIRALVEKLEMISSGVGVVPLEIKVRHPPQLPREVLMRLLAYARIK